MFIAYTTAAGIERKAEFDTEEQIINLDLRDIATVDLLPLVWAEDLEVLCLRHNRIDELDLTPLSKCKNLEMLSLTDNCLKSINLSPLSDCPNLIELALNMNPLESIDISPLFECAKLDDLKVDDDVSLKADLFLRSIGNWPQVLIDLYPRILWKTSG
ncbi:MAG: leucine-rich repeat domain-containing protein [Candidatus Thorarchaeota archaeon]